MMRSADYESRQWYGLLQDRQPLARRLGGASHRVLDEEEGMMLLQAQIEGEALCAI